jgi:hypothetical protein
MTAALPSLSNRAQIYRPCSEPAKFSYSSCPWPPTAGAPRASAPANPWTNRLHRLMRHFGPNHATDFFTTMDFVSRRVVIPAGARASRAEPGPGQGPPPFVLPQGNAEVLRRLVGGQAPERAGMDVIRRFARLRLSGCHPDSASNVSCRGRTGRSSPTRPLSSQPTSGPLRLSPRGPETPYQHGQSEELSGCSSTGGRSRGAACRRPLVGSCPAAGSRAPPLRQIAGPAGRGQMGERGSGGQINRCHR